MIFFFFVLTCLIVYYPRVYILHNLYESLTDTKHSSCADVTIHMLLADLSLAIKNI